MNFTLKLNWLQVEILTAFPSGVEDVFQPFFLSVFGLGFKLGSGA